MHFLAHLHLAQGNPYEQIGQIAGDFAKGLVLEELHAQVQLGVRRHRTCDSFTDSHANTRRAKELMSGPYRRYSGLVLDLYYDHLLALHWRELAGGELRKDVDEMYASLEAHQSDWTEGMQRFTRYLIDSDLLHRLLEPEVMQVGLKRITSRLKRPVDLSPAIDQIMNNREEHTALFLEFYPQLQAAVRQSHH